MAFLKRGLLTGVGAVGLGMIVVGFQNCSQGGFEVISISDKQAVLSSQNVFETQGVSTRPEGAVDTNISVRSDGTGSDIAVKYYCTTLGAPGVNRLSDTTTAYLQIRDDRGALVCDDELNQYGNIVNFKKIRVAGHCFKQMTAGKSYSVRVYDPTQTLYSLGNTSAAFNSSSVAATFQFDGQGLKPQSANLTYWVLYDYNPDLGGRPATSAPRFRTPVDGGPDGVDPDNCDTKASPLVTLLGDSNSRIELTAPTAGVFFDILGLSSAPVAHTKKRISWFLNRDNNYFFIALPNENGDVLGVDQLFGDNTLGPDGRLAANGYEALAKFDVDGDGLITAKDPVFHSLRLWNDRSLDGIAQPDELFTLTAKDVVTIDLNYDGSFQETDFYGNQTLMKSVVKTGDGKLHLLFDLWFRSFR